MLNNKTTVGIITFHRAHNYGAVLQCLALKTVCEKLGYNTFVIDHRNPKLEYKYSLCYKPNNRVHWVKQFKNWLKYLFIYPAIREKNKRFNSFISQYLLHPTLTSIPNCWGAIIWGSDQIWRKDIIGDDPVYFGHIDFKTNRKIVYAGSMGKIDSSIESEIESIRNFNAISVREIELSAFLLKKGIQSQTVLDPTLLLSIEEWRKLLPITKKTKAFLLVYAMRNRGAVIKAAKIVAAQRNIGIVEIYSDIGFNNFKKPFSASSPIEFVNLFAEADFVVTDSFHGTSFSIIFNKQFYTVRLNDGHDNRAENLLSSVGLQDRLISTIPESEKDIDYSKVNQKLERMRSNSIKFLSENITN